MKLKTFLEEFKTGVKHGKKYFEIFVNPTSKEIREAGKNTNNIVRYIIDKKKKKLYIFPANLLHDEASEELKIRYVIERSTDVNFIFSQGKVVKEKIYSYLPSSAGARKYIKKTEWLKRYFTDKS